MLKNLYLPRRVHERLGADTQNYYIENLSATNNVYMQYSISLFNPSKFYMFSKLIDLLLPMTIGTRFTNYIIEKSLL